MYASPYAGSGDWGRGAFPLSPAPECAARLHLSRAPRPLLPSVSASLSVIPLGLRAGAISLPISFLGHYCIFAPAFGVVSVFSSLFKKSTAFSVVSSSARQSWSFQSASLNRLRGKKRKKEKFENFCKFCNICQIFENIL